MKRIETIVRFDSVGGYFDLFGISTAAVGYKPEQVV